VATTVWLLRCHGRGPGLLPAVSTVSAPSWALPRQAEAQARIAELNLESLLAIRAYGDGGADPQRERSFFAQVDRTRYRIGANALTIRGAADRVGSAFGM